MKKITKLLAATGISLAAIAGVIALTSQSAAISQTPAVFNGQLNGQFSVTQNGAVNYDIQVSLPPGTANFQPDIEIDYSSQSGNGLAGMGFALNGFSRITRTGATIPQDGFKGGVNYDDGDRLQLDGSRLMNINTSSDAYCYDGAVFMTQLQSWTKVVAHGQAGQGASWFSVQLKNGTQLQYGNTTDSKVLALGQAFSAGTSSAGSVREWLLNQATDLNGNVIRFFYTASPKDSLGNTIANLAGLGVSYPDVICYTMGHGQNAQRKVKFYYERRNDTLVRFQGGAGIEIPLRVAGIQTVLLGADGDSSTVSNYHLRYETQTPLGISRMASIVQQGARGAYAQPTSFSWTNGASGLVASSGITWQGPTSSNSGFEGDFNGDGLTDIVPISGNNLSAIYFSSPSGFSKTTISPSILTNATTYVADYNGDGLPDVFVCTSSSAGKIYFCNGQGFNSPVSVSGLHVNTSGTNCAWAADFNGDGKSDFLTVQGSAAYLSLGSSAGLTYTTMISGLKLLQGQIFVADYNGDGLNDIYSGNASGGTLYLSDFSKGNGFQPPVTVGGITTSNVSSCGQCNLISDFNSDGMTDIMTHTGNQYNLYYSNGHGFEPATALNNISLNLSQNWISDFNGDGFMDFYAQNSQGDSSMIYYFTGKKFIKNTLQPTNFVPSASWLGDFNGDGISDIFAANKSTIWYGGDAKNNVVPQNNQVPNLVSSVNNGIGNVQNILYKAITDTAVYTKGAPVGTGVDGLNFQNNVNAAPLSPSQISLYPFSRVQEAMYVVKTYSNSDGRGNVYGYDYRYAGFLTDMQAYGSLGFRTVTKTDTSAKNITTTNYLQLFPYTGKTQYSTVTDLSKRLLTQIRNQYASTTLTRGALKSVLYQVNQMQSRVMHYDYGSFAYTGGNNYQYDGFGNQTLSVALGDTTEPTNFLYTIKTYLNDTVNWSIGLTSSSVQAPNADGTNPLTQSTYSYDPVTRNLLKKSNWLNTSNTWLSTNYQYDVYGNTTTQINQSGDTSRTVYDSIYHTFPARIISPPNQYGRKLVSALKHDARFGSMVQATDANGNQFYNYIDQFGRDSVITGPDSTGKQVILAKTKYFLLNPAGYGSQSIRAVDWGNTLWDSSSTLYDGMGRSYENTSQGQNGEVVTQQFYYNSNKKVIKKSVPHFADSAALWITTSYDPYQRISAVVYPRSATHRITTNLTYLGKQVTVHEAVGSPDSSLTTLAYDFYNGSRKIVSRSKAGEQSTYSYDLLGRNKALADPTGLSMSATYNSLGDIVQTYNPSSGNNYWLYDYVNHRTAFINNAADTIVDTFDKLGRQIRKRIGKLASYYFQYDLPGYKNANGNLCRVLMPDTTVSYRYGYDAYNNQVMAALSYKQTMFRQLYSFNPDRSNDAIVYPDASVCRFSYYNNGFLKNLSFKDASVGNASFAPFVTYSQYNAEGDQTGINYGNGVSRTASFYALGKLNSYQIKNSGATLIDQSYDWSDVNTVTGIEDHLNDQYSQDFYYQLSGRLDSARGGYGLAQFAYDHAGNMTLKDSMTLQYTNYQAVAGIKNNRKLFSASYDANGNMRRRTWNDGKDSSTMIYHFDVQNRLRSVCSQEDTLFTFAYSYTGQRLLKVDKKNHITTLYVSPQYEITTTPDSIYSTKYITAPGNIVASVTHAKPNTKSARQQTPAAAGLPQSGITYFHQNFVNTTNITTNASGAVSSQYHYKPFGEQYSVSGTSDARYTFGSKEMDETGLYYFSSRYYDPVTTRFISADNQLGGSRYQNDALNRYAYTLNDPVKYYDPSGHALGFLEIGLVLGIEAVGAVVTDGAALPEEIALDATMIEAGEEVGVDFLNALRETRASGQVSNEQCISIYKAKRSALLPGGSQYEIHPGGLGIEDDPRTIGRDIHGNDVFNNIGSADAVSLQYEIAEAANYKNPNYADLFPNTDDLQRIGGAMERTKGFGGFKFALSFDDYSLRISHNYLDDYVKHSLLTGEGREGRDVFTAGTVDIENGNLIIRNYSGHYRPNKESLKMADPIWRMMRNNGYLNFNNIIYQ